MSGGVVIFPGSRAPLADRLAELREFVDTIPLERLGEIERLVPGLAERIIRLQGELYRVFPKRQGR